MTDKKVNNSGFDIGTLVGEDESTGQFMQLTHPVNGEPLLDGDNKEIGIYLLGKDSSVYRNAQRSVTNRRLNSKGSSTITAERIEAEAIEILAKCTVSWTGILYKGEPLVCGPGAARKLYTEAPWVKEQVDEFIAERANHLGK